MKRPFSKKTEQPRRRQIASEQAGASDKSLFKRNRTLVGSLSSSVSSASELTGDLQSPRAHVHHLTRHRRRISTILTGVIVLSGVLVWLLYEFTAGIHVSSTQNGLVIPQDRYQKAIDQYFGAHPIERFRFLLNAQQLTKSLQQSVPEVSSAIANGSAGFATTQFDLTFRQPTASWLIGSTQYYVDKEGVSFVINYFDTPGVKIVDQSGVPQVAGTAVASSRFLTFIGRTVDIAKTYGLTVEQAIIPVNTTRQIEIKVVGKSYPIKLSLDRSVGEQIEDAQRAIAWFSGKNITPEYVDVRVSGKAFYK